MRLPIDIHPEVQQAQSEGKAVVALESTLITHGMSPPHSFNLPVECEDILRAQGVAPATIAIINGRIKVGLTHDELAMLAEKGFEARKDGGKSLWKVGRRELGAAVVKKMDGGTTVSGTMAVAHMTGIKIFSTGGIGGVHRGAETSFDISSDLISLSDTPVAVVCAGSKSILDIGLTLEYLEAHAVPVAGYGTDEWPAFYSPISGFKAPMRLDSTHEIASTIRTTSLLSLPSSLLVGVPIPEQYHSVGAEIQAAVEIAVRESVENGVSKTGKGVTPWLLGRVGELTKGKAVESNMALIKNNVKVGGEIALEYAKILRQETSSSSFMPALRSVASKTASAPSATPSIPSSKPDILPSIAPLAVVGALAVDITMSPLSSPHHTTSPGRVSLSLGGVAGNVASASHSLLNSPSDVLLIAPIGDDLFGGVVKEGLKVRGMRRDGLILVGNDERSPTCGILLDPKGDLMGGVADMGIVELLEGSQVTEKLRDADPKVVCFDGNIAAPTMKDVLEFCSVRNVDAFFEPTSNQKALRLLRAVESLPPRPVNSLPVVSYSTPNIHELTTLYSHINESEREVYEMGLWFDGITVSHESLSTLLPEWIVKEGVVQMAVRLLPVVGCLFIKSGSRGVVVVQRVSGIDEVAPWTSLNRRKGTIVVPSTLTATEAIIIRHYPAFELEEAEVGTVTGAGDNLAGAMLAGLVRGWSTAAPEDLDKIVNLGQKAAVATLRSREAVGDHTALRELLPAL